MTTIDFTKYGCTIEVTIAGDPFGNNQILRKTFLDVRFQPSWNGGGLTVGLTDNYLDGPFIDLGLESVTAISFNRTPVVDMDDFEIKVAAFWGENNTLIVSPFFKTNPPRFYKILQIVSDYKGTAKYYFGGLITTKV